MGSTAATGDGLGVSIPDVSQADEGVVQAITGTTNGWLAVGSIHRTGSVSEAAMWDVGLDGQFGLPALLPPLVPGVPVTARSAVELPTDQRIVVGNSGIGQASTPVAWTQSPTGWIATPLPTDEYTHGAITDRILLFTNGAIAVIGRTESPSYPTLYAWTSHDNGATWAGQSEQLSSYDAPLVATDGQALLIMFRSETAESDRYPLYETMLLDQSGQQVGWNDDYVRTPRGGGGEVTAMVWTGTEYVAAANTADGPMLARSPDGATFDAYEPIIVDGTPLGPEHESFAVEMASGQLTAFFNVGGTVSVFHEVAGGFTQTVEAPVVTTANMSYLNGREPVATYLDRGAWLDVEWDTRTMVTWQGGEWTTTDVSNVPIHRNPTSSLVSQFATAGDVELAAVLYRSSAGNGDTTNDSSSLVIRTAGSADFIHLDVSGIRGLPVSVLPFGNGFAVSAWEPRLDETTWYLVDPATLAFTATSVVPGYVDDALVAGGRVFAVVHAVTGEYGLLASTDAATWTYVPAEGEPRALCSDSVDVALVWTRVGEPDATQSGVAVVSDNTLVPVGQTIDLVSDDYLGSMVCGVNKNAVVVIRPGYTDSVDYPTPVVRYVPRHSSEVDRGESVMLLPGAWETWIRGVVWIDEEWVAIGDTRDVEGGWDVSILRSRSGKTWIDADTQFGGAGNQLALVVRYEAGALVVGGQDGQHASLNTVPLLT